MDFKRSRKKLNLKVGFTIEYKGKDKEETFYLLTHLNWLDCVNNRNTVGKNPAVDFSVFFEDQLNGQMKAILIMISYDKSVSCLVRNTLGNPLRSLRLSCSY